MGIVAVKETPNRDGEVEARKNNLLFEVYGRRYKREWTIWTSNSRDGSETILADPMCPVVIGSSYTSGNDADEVATCIKITVNATNNMRIWKLVAEYDTDRLVAAVIDNPLNQPPKVSWVTEDYEKPLPRDVFGNPLVSSSKNAFDPPYMQNYKRAVLRVVRNEATFTSEYSRNYAGMLNVDEFNGWPQLCAKINKMDGELNVSNGVQFWSVSYEIEFREEGFRIPILDQDFRDAKGNLFRDKRDGSPLSNQTPLNGRGMSMFDAVSKLQGSIGTSDTSITIKSDDVSKFPPDYGEPDDDGIIRTPMQTFYVRIEDEILEVTDGADTATFTVERGANGTFAAAHADQTPVSLEPVYLWFLGDLYTEFAPLSLPVV